MKDQKENITLIINGITKEISVNETRKSDGCLAPECLLERQERL